MTARDVIRHALLVYYAESQRPDWIASRLLDDYRGMVLAEDGQAYPGELAMLRSLVRTLRATVRPDSATVAEVRQLLHHHVTDETAAYAEQRGKSSRTPADATPAGPTGRVGQLLDAIRTARGEWPVHRAIAFYRDNVPGLKSMPHQHLRTVARGDLRDLTAWGHLVRHDPDGTRRFYTLKTRKDGRS